jgi:uncharacterized protein YqfA (UPF0365 family)
MDYYNFQNIQADTKMRSSLADGGTGRPHREHEEGT